MSEKQKIRHRFALTDLLFIYIYYLLVIFNLFIYLLFVFKNHAFILYINE